MPRYYTIFKTEVGACALSWGLEGISSFFLPEVSQAELRKKVKAFAGEEDILIEVDEIEMEINGQYPLIGESIKSIKGHLGGNLSSLNEIPLDYSKLPPFFVKVYQQLRKKVGPGRTVTYGELAKICGNPHGARAVGQAMRRNPFPLLIPCHRVLSPKKELRGFSAYGGIQTKMRLLVLEGALQDKGAHQFKLGQGAHHGHLHT